MSRGPLEPMRAMCATCPFREGSAYAFLRNDLARSALTEGTRICHSTGPRNAVVARPKGKARACRGARDLQLRYFAATGFLPEPTDKAWADKLAEIKGGRR